MTTLVHSDSIETVEKKVAGSSRSVASLVTDLKPSDVHSLLSAARDEERPYGTAMVLGATANEHAKNATVALLQNSGSDTSQDGKVTKYWLDQLGPVALALTAQTHGTMASMLGNANLQKALSVATGGAIDPWGREGQYQRGLAANRRAILGDVGPRLQQVMGGGGYEKDTSITDILGWTPEQQDGVFYMTELFLCGSRGLKLDGHHHGEQSTGTWMHRVLPQAQHRFVDSGMGLRRRRLGSAAINRVVDDLYSDEIGSGVGIAGFDTEDCAYETVIAPSQRGQRSPTGTFTLVDKTRQLAAGFRAVPHELSAAGKAKYGAALNSVATLYDAVAANFEYALAGHPPVTQAADI